LTKGHNPGVNGHIKEAWIKAAGAQLPAWDAIKKELIGSLAKFDKLYEAANTKGDYFVDDVKA